MSERQQTSLFVLVSGWPGSGKTTLSTELAAALGLPLLAKDAIKEALMDTLGRPTTVAESQRLGGAAVRAMLAVAASCPGAVMDSTWYPYTRPLLETLPGSIVEVRCCCPVDVARSRYQARAGTRQAGHLDALRTEDELWSNQPPLGVGRFVEVDTTRPVDAGTLARSLRS